MENCASGTWPEGARAGQLRCSQRGLRLSPLCLQGDRAARCILTPGLQEPGSAHRPGHTLRRGLPTTPALATSCRPWLHGPGRRQREAPAPARPGPLQAEPPLLRRLREATESTADTRAGTRREEKRTDARPLAPSHLVAVVHVRQQPGLPRLLKLPVPALLGPAGKARTPGRGASPLGQGRAAAAGPGPACACGWAGGPRGNPAAPGPGFPLPSPGGRLPAEVVQGQLGPRALGRGAHGEACLPQTLPLPLPAFLLQPPLEDPLLFGGQLRERLRVPARRSSLKVNGTPLLGRQEAGARPQPCAGPPGEKDGAPGAPIPVSARPTQQVRRVRLRADRLPGPGPPSVRVS